MSRRWVIYGLMVDGRCEYIGHAQHLAARICQHRSDRFFGVDFCVDELGTAATKDAARRLEARMIKRHNPPKNIQLKGRRSYELVSTIRWTGTQWLPCTFRLFAGMQHPDKARKVWLGKRPSKVGAALKLMPGWQASRASYMFGPRDYQTDEDAMKAIKAIEPEYSSARVRKAYGPRYKRDV